jgi:thiamine pyrophosphokinase
VQDPIERGARLAFSGLLAVVGGGALDDGLLRELAAGGAALVGADGGGDAIRAAGLVPDAIIGDFDSLLDPESWGPETRLLHITEQLTTDFEKVLYSTAAPVTVALGMTGKRLDHTLAALDATIRFAPERKIILVDESDLAVALAGSFEMTVERGARVSIHPLTPTHFARSDGLKYPLDGLFLAPGVRTGTSNEASAESFSVTQAPGDQGVWLLLLERRWLNALVSRLAR